MEIAALALSIIVLLVDICGAATKELSSICILCSLLAIIFGAIKMKSPTGKKELATGSFVCGIIALIWSVIEGVGGFFNSLFS